MENGKWRIEEMTNRRLIKQQPGLKRIIKYGAFKYRM